MAGVTSHWDISPCFWGKVMKVCKWQINPEKFDYVMHKEWLLCYWRGLKKCWGPKFCATFPYIAFMSQRNQHPQRDTHIPLCSWGCIRAAQSQWVQHVPGTALSGGTGGVCLGNLGWCIVVIPPDHAKQKELNADSGKGISPLWAKGMASAPWTNLAILQVWKDR